MMRSWSSCLFCILAILCFGLTLVGQAEAAGKTGSATRIESSPTSASISANMDPSAPDENLQVAGTGFAAGETVSILVFHQQMPGVVGSVLAGWETVADANGNIYTGGIVDASGYSLDAIAVKATGSQSGEEPLAKMTETDSRITLISWPESTYIHEPFEVTILLEQNCCCEGNFAPLANREVSFYAHIGDCGVDPTQTPLATVVTDANGLATATLTINMLGTWVVGVKYDGELEPDSTMEPNSACDPSQYVTILPSIGCCEVVVDWEPPKISCYAGELETFLGCVGESVCFDVEIISQGAGELRFSLPAGTPGTVDPITGEVCVLPDTAGTYLINVIASDSAGQIASCEAYVNIDLNQPPDVHFISEGEFAGPCYPDTVCIPYQVSDPDGNLEELIPSMGWLDDGFLCVEITEGGNHTVTLTATDTCGVSDVASVTINSEMYVDPSIDLGEDLLFFQCQPEMVCIPVQTVGVYEVLETSLGEYDIALGMICFMPDGQTTEYQMIAQFEDYCGVVVVDTLSIDITYNSAPTITGTTDTTLEVCLMDTLCLPIDVNDPDGNLYVVGASEGYYNEQEGTYCVLLPADEQFSFDIIASDSCAASDTLTVSVTTYSPPPPTIELSGADSVLACGPETFCYDVITVDNVYDVSTNFGSWNPNTGTICFELVEPGMFVIHAVVTDSCMQTAEVWDTLYVMFNSAPTVEMFNDTAMYLCGPEEICLPVNVFDIDGNLQTVVVNEGEYRDGMICFTPYDAGTYTFALTATDSCGETTSGTASVEVMTDQGITLNCPNDTTVYTCYRDTVYIPVNYIGDSDYLHVDVWGLNAWWDGERNAVGIFVECSNQTTVTIMVESPCDTYECTFDVTVECNQAPLVILPPDSTIFNCGDEPICFPAGISDPNDNITDVAVNFGTYDPATGLICFTPDTAGIYTISAVATDDCDESGADEVVFEIVLNHPPVCKTFGDTTVFICGPGSVMLPVHYDDEDFNGVGCTVIDGPGQVVDGYWVWDNASAGTYTIVFLCADECGATCESSCTVTIVENSAPLVACPEYFEPIFVCELDTFCVTQPGITDIDDNLSEVFVSVNGQPYEYTLGSDICFVPVEGANNILVVASDDCGDSAACDIPIYFEVNSAPELTDLADTSFFLCDEPIFLERYLEVIDPDGNQAYLEVLEGPGSIEGNMYSATFEQGGEYTVVIGADDQCNLYDIDTFLVTITANQPPMATCPADDSAYFCEPGSNLYVPGFFAEDPDGNLSYISASVIGTGEQLVLMGDTLVYPVQASEQTTILFMAVDSCGALDSCHTKLNIEVNTPPFDMSEIRDINTAQCEPMEICRDLIAGDLEGNFAYWELVEGPGSIVDSTWCFTPLGETNDVVIIRGYDDCGAYFELTFNLYIYLNMPPVASDSYYSDGLCFPGEIRNLQADAYDPEVGPLTYSLLSGPGNIDPATGMITYTVNSTGVYTFEFVATDTCQAADTGMVVDTIDVNIPPKVNTFDTTIYLCEVDTICFEVTADDADGDELDFFQEHGPGSSTLIGPNTLQTCFLPYDEDTMLYIFIYCAYDECGLAGLDQPTPPPAVCCTDTVTVTVIKNQKPEIDCPGPQMFSVCEADSLTFCIPISAYDPDGDVLDGEILSGNATWNFDTQTVCVFPSLTGEHSVTFRLFDHCGNADTCTIPVMIDGNVPPGIELADDFTTKLCAPAEICVDVMVGDADGDEFVTEFNFGQYDIEGGQVCFTADTAGVYEIIGTVSDSCGAMGVDTALVTVILNEGPTVNIPGGDVTTGICTTTEVCVDVNYTDPDGPVVDVYSNYGSYEQGRICALFDAAGVYDLIVVATDDCGAVDTATITITITEDDPPYVSLGDDFDTHLCDLMPVCVDVIVPDGLASAIPNFGQYDTETDKLCFTPDTAGVYTLVMTVTDSCDLTGVDTVVIGVGIDQPPVVTCPEPQNLAICESTEICLPIAITDPEGEDYDVDIESDLQYTFVNDTLCLVANQTGEFNVMITVTDACGNTDECSFPVTIDLNSEPTVVLADPMNVTLCRPQQVCFSAEINDIDLDLVSLDISNGTYDEQLDRICVDVDTTGTYVVVATAEDSCGHIAADTTFITATVNDAPTLSLGDDFARNLCQPEEICVDVETSATDQLIIPNIGQYDMYTGQVCFFAEVSGMYQLIVTVEDSCGWVAIDTVNIDVTVNTAPTLVMGNDTTVYLCAPDEICVPAVLTDLEGNLETIDVIGGVYKDDMICVTPYDSGTYTVILTAVDSCGLSVSDTATITIRTDQEANLVCPNDTSLFACVNDTICLPISGIPEGAHVETWGINTWFDEETGNVCFYTACGNSNNITVMVETPCNTYECSFTVNIDCNVAPLVLLPPDTSFMVCGPQEICVPVGVSDPNDNLYMVTSDGGYYDAALGKLCFDADTSGIYELTVTAEDSCGEVSTDAMFVTVDYNTPPVVNYTWQDTLISTCVPEVCFPITVFDGEFNLASVVTDWGTYDEQTDEVCITVDTNGVYCVQIIAIDECGLADTLDACINVETGDFVYIECPDQLEPVILCGPDSIMIPIGILGNNYQVTSSIGFVENGYFHFYADSAGVYGVDVYGTAECNSDSCSFAVEVMFEDEVTVTCAADTSLLLCEPDTVCFPFTASPNATYRTYYTSTEVEGYMLDNENVCLYITEPGEITVTVEVMSDCDIDSCTFTVTSAFNSAPVVTAAEDTSFVACEPSEICLPFQASDVDGNIIEIQSSMGEVTDSTVCFTPPDFGSYTIIITARDECGETDTDSVSITIQQGGTPLVICPPATQYDTLCYADTVCVVVPVSPTGAQVTVSPEGVYNYETGEVCVFIEETRTIEITVSAEATCGVDSCSFTLDVIVDNPPVVTCPGTIDTMLCLAQPTTLCYPVSMAGTASSIETSFGTYANGQVCFEVSEAGSFIVDLVANGVCSSDTCRTVINVERDSDPTLYLPTELFVFERCPDDSDLICIDGIYATDVESDVTLTKSCGVGEFELVTNDSGQICFLPDGFGMYEFCFEANDGCNTTEGSFFVEIVEEEDCDVCIYVEIEVADTALVGLSKDVAIRVNTDMALGGFDLLVSYDASVMTFVYASIENTAIHDGTVGWEYFDFRLNSAGCGQGCPSGLVRFVGIADVNNGPSHPPDDMLIPNGVLINTQFQVANDINLSDQFLPINFVWYDCGDNSFSDTTGNELYVDVRIYNDEGNLRWDENDDVNYPESSRPYGLGATDECFGVGKVDPIRCIEFYNGGIKVIHKDSIDDRGDINLNGIAYEIADAVVFSNYFIFGLEVFVINIPGQIAATDINADGVTLSVADLVLLIRVIIGDADPLPKLVPYSEELIVSTVATPEKVELSTRAPGEIGAGLFVFDIDGDVTIDEPALKADAERMDVIWGISDGQLKVLVMNFGSERIETGQREIFELPISGNGTVTLREAEVVDYQGRPYEIAYKGVTVPRNFSLAQNYPNPFNPSTTIEFALPEATDWSLTVYNVQGKVVRTFSGDYPAGNHKVTWDSRNDQGMQVASGVYFYRLDAGQHSQVKKMMLVK